MKTTELFVEQLIIGLAVVLTGSAMVWPGFATTVYEHAGTDLSKAAIVLAGSYLIGIVYDRVSDTLLQDLEQHHRLLYALGLHYGAPQESDDPFPEDAWRIKVMNQPGASDHADYLRSRIRLTRAFTTLVPAMTMAAVLGRADSPRMRLAAALTTLAIYMAAFVFKITRRPRLPEEAPVAASQDYALPRTKRLRDDGVRTWYEARIGGYDQEQGRSTRGWQFALRNEPLAVVAIFLSVAAGVIAGVRQGPPLGVVTGVGVCAASVTATALFGWSWWRISDTLFAFLKTATRA